MPLRILFVALLTLLPGCFLSRTSVNEPISPARLAHLEPGTSTALDVVDALGAPMEVVQLARRSAYRYDYSVSKRAGAFLLLVFMLSEDTRQDRVWVFFDENDVLTHIGSTFNAAETHYTLPWSNVHDDHDDDDEHGDDAD